MVKLTDCCPTKEEGWLIFTLCDMSDTRRGVVNVDRLLCLTGEGGWGTTKAEGAEVSQHCH